MVKYTTLWKDQCAIYSFPYHLLVFLMFPGPIMTSEIGPKGSVAFVATDIPGVTNTTDATDWSD